MRGEAIIPPPWKTKRDILGAMVRGVRVSLCARQWLLALLLALPLSAQTIYFDKVEPAVLEDRLGRVARKTEERAALLRGLFEEAGCRQLSELPVKGSRHPNVVCVLEGTGPGRLVVGAHYDMTGSGQGIVDNWSGAALLSSLYQSLNGKVRNLTIVFVGFSDEEKGLVGAKSFVKQMSDADRDRLRAMVNIDSVGLGPAKVWGNRANKDLLRKIGMVAGSLNLPLGIVNVEKVGDSDSHPFLDKDIPVIDIHSVTQETLPVLHSAQDTAEAIRKQDYFETYHLVAAFLAFLDVTLGAEERM
jgi:hypothetical protein